MQEEKTDEEMERGGGIEKERRDKQMEKEIKGRRKE